VRLVLDTNIYVSALLSVQGAPGRLLSLARHRHVRLLTSSDQVAELERVLGYDRIARRVARDQADHVLRNLLSVAEIVFDPPRIELSPDPADNLILAIAIGGKADALVTGDRRHLLDLDDSGGVKIITAREALNTLRDSRDVSEID